MNHRADEDPTPTSVEDAAGYWDARLRAPDATKDDRLACREWRAADPAHDEAFVALQGLISGFPTFATRPEIQSMRAAALRRSQDTTLRNRQYRLRLIAAGSIAASFAAIIATTYHRALPGSESPTQQATRSDTSPSFTTDVGERTTIPLSDGSAATLNTDSRILVTYGTRGRGVTLVRGEAHFHVARDTRRPFTVYAGSYQVTAIGTAFDVRLEGKNVQVTVTEGRVAVREVGADKVANVEVAELRASEQFVALEGSRSLRRHAEIAVVSSWRDGRVVFDDVPLATAVQEMNRYSTTKLTIRDQGIAFTRVSGIFKTGDQATFVEALERYFAIDARRQSAAEVLLEPAPL